jgi:hypothetical protein
MSNPLHLPLHKRYSRYKIPRSGEAPSAKNQTSEKRQTSKSNQADSAEGGHTERNPKLQTPNTSKLQLPRTPNRKFSPPRAGFGSVTSVTSCILPRVLCSWKRDKPVFAEVFAFFGKRAGKRTSVPAYRTLTGDREANEEPGRRLKTFSPPAPVWKREQAYHRAEPHFTEVFAIL